MADEEPGKRGETLAQHIAALVLDGEIAPGQKLDEQVLAQRFEVSRTPVREALRALASTGLIELKPNRGAFVSCVTPQQLEEMFTAMAELEAACARLSAMSMSPIERRELSRMHEHMAELARAGMIPEFVQANERFHSLIYSGAHNVILAEAATSLRRRLALYRRSQFRTAGRLARSHAEHDEVVKAVVSGDPARAHAAMLHHVSLVEASYEKLLATVSNGLQDP
jgi:DNA-binding GntR family transcriptional regulator